MNKSIKIIATTAGVGALGLAGGLAAGSLLTHELVAAAMDREEPKILIRERKKLSEDPVFGEFFKKCKLAAEKLKAIPHENVTLTLRDGTHLAAHLYATPNAEKTLIMMHGWRSGWALDFGLQSDYLLGCGINLLFAEERGQGESEGEYITFGILEREDTLEWAKFAAGRFPNTEVFLYGVSMGGASVLMASDLDFPSNVRGIIADCAFTSPGEIWEHILKKQLHMTKHLHGKLSEKLCEKRINLSSGRFNTEKSLALCRLPVLLIHGSDDRIVPVEMTYRNATACRGERKMLIVPGADHAMSYSKDPRSYERELSAFMRL